MGVMTDREVEALVERSTPQACIVPRGRVLAMRPLLVHASSKSRSEAPRRVVHFEYASSLELTDGMKLAIA
jgi:hypothetical protein